MDVCLYALDGEATELIHVWDSETGARRTPIIALTAHASMYNRNDPREKRLLTIYSALISDW